MHSQLPPAVLDRYAEHKASLPAEVIGLMLIGSRALEQSVAESDFDTRLVVRSEVPYVRCDGPVWTTAPEVPAVVFGWADLNPTPGQGVSFGLTNLSFIERCIQDSYFPLNDHTALFQGAIGIDDTGAVTEFCERYRGIRFTNIAADYLAQTSWRVSRRLSRERAAMRLGEGLDLSKHAVPALHTCCRILQEMVQIAVYRQQGLYLRQMALIAEDFATRWPVFIPTFQALFRYKTEEAPRRVMFEGIQSQDLDCLAEAEALVEQTMQVWQRFVAQ
jgi:hypothetical protein